MELDFRTKDGTHKVSFYGDLAEKVSSYLVKQPDIYVGTMTSKGKKINCYQSTNPIGTGFKMAGELEVLIQAGEFVKIIK